MSTDRKDEKKAPKPTPVTPDPDDKIGISVDDDPVLIADLVRTLEDVVRKLKSRQRRT